MVTVWTKALSSLILIISCYLIALIPLLVEDLGHSLTMTLTSCDSCSYRKIPKLNVLSWRQFEWFSSAEESSELTLPQGGISLCELTSASYLLPKELTAVFTALTASVML